MAVDRRLPEICDFPPAPWTLRGDALCVARLVCVRDAAALVPAGVKIVSLLPGKTLALMCLARYGAGSTLRYHELIVMPAIVRAFGRIGGWISHIHVDSDASCAAGRRIWGLPKESALFEWQWPRLRASHPKLEVRMIGGREGVRAPLPLLAPAFGGAATSLKWFVGRGAARLARMPGTVSVSGDPRLERLGFDRAESLYSLSPMHMRLAAPA